MPMPKLVLQDGWQVALEFIKGPLALVSFTRGSQSLRARFDVDKRAFIDKIPSDVTAEKRDELAHQAQITAL